MCAYAIMAPVAVPARPGSSELFIASNMERAHFDYLVYLLNAGCTLCWGARYHYRLDRLDRLHRRSSGQQSR